MSHLARACSRLLSGTFSSGVLWVLPLVTALKIKIIIDYRERNGCGGRERKKVRVVPLIDAFIG